MASMCNICADGLFILDKELSAVPCGHVFHRSCLDQWWSQKQTCPNCRSAFDQKIDKLYLANLEVDGNERLNLRIQSLEKSAKKSEDDKKLLETKLRKKIAILQKRPTYKEIEALKGTISALEVEITIVREESDKQQAKAEEMIQLKTACIEQLQMLVLQKDKKLKETERLEEESVTFEVDLLESRRRIAGLEDEVSSIRAEYDLLRAAAFEKIQLLREAKNSLHQLRTVCDQKLESASHDYETLRFFINNFESESHALRRKLTDRETKIGELQGKVCKMRQSNTSLGISIILFLLVICFGFFCKSLMMEHLHM